MKRKRNASLTTQIADLSTLWNEALDQSCSTILTQQWIKSHGNRWKNSTILIDLIKKIHICHSWYQKLLPINIWGVTEKNYFHKNNLDISFQCNKRPLLDKEIEWREKESKVILWHYNEKIIIFTLLQKYCKADIKFDGNDGFAACNSKTYNSNHKNREFCRREIQSHQEFKFSLWKT